MLVLYIQTTGWITGQPRNGTCDEMIYGSYIATFLANHGNQERQTRFRLAMLDGVVARKVAKYITDNEDRRQVCMKDIIMNVL